MMYSLGYTKFNKLKHLFEQYIKKMPNKNMFTNITEDERLEIFNVNYEKIFKHKYIPQTSPTHIGYIYWFNLIHDPNYGTSAIGNMNLDNRNYPADKSNSKKVMESLFSEASSKLCVQTLGITSSMVHEEAYYKLLEEKVIPKNYSLSENLTAVGLNLEFQTKNED